MERKLSYVVSVLDVVAALEDFPEKRIARGQVGTVLERLDRDAVLVEFAGLEGVAYAVTPLPAGKLLKLRHTPAK